MLALLIVGAVGLAASLTHASPGAATEPAKASALFEWSMPARFGDERDKLGRLVEASPESVSAGPWTVLLQVNAASCRDDVTYHWSLNGRPLDVRRGPGCAFSATFPKEGAYPVRVDATVDGRALTQTQRVTVQDWLIVSIGDSVASGEAVPDVPGFVQSRWQSPRCHRSARAAPAKAAQQIEQDDDHTSVTFVHLACSGATIAQGIVGPYDGVLQRPFSAPLPAQVDEVTQIAARRHIDALLLSVGANDVYFGDVVRSCAKRLSTNCFDDPLPDEEHRTIRSAVHDALVALPAGYGMVAKALAPAVAAQDIHIVGYFDPTRDAHGQTCGLSLGDIGAGELELAQTQVLGPLNNAVKAAADLRGWDAITGIDVLFHDHGYCAGRDTWVTTLSQSLATNGGPIKGRFLGTLHPNEAGQSAIAAAIARSLEKQFYPDQTILPGQSPPTPAPRSDTLPTLAAIAIVAAGALSILGAGLLAWLLRRRLGVLGGVLVCIVGAGLVALAIGVRDTPSVAAALAAVGGSALVVGVLLATLQRQPGGQSS